MTGERSSRIKIRVENKDYDVVGGDFQQILMAVKALPERRFNSGLKVWEISGSMAMVRGQLENSGFTIEGGTPVSQAAEVKPTPSHDRIKIVAANFAMIVSGAPFHSMLEAIKDIPGRRFDGQTKQWIIPGTLHELKAYFAKKNLQLEVLPGQPALPAESPTAEAFGSPFDTESSPPLDPHTPSADHPLAPPPLPPDLFPPFPPDEGLYEEEAELDEVSFSADPFLPPPDTPPPAAPAPTSTPPRPSRRDQIRVIIDNKPMVVVGGTFRDMLAAIKALPDRRFDGETKQWLLAADIESVQQHLAAKGFRLEAS